MRGGDVGRQACSCDNVHCYRVMLFRGEMTVLGGALLIPARQVVVRLC